MQNKLACKRDSEHNAQAAMPLADRILGKMSKKRDYSSFAVRFSCPAFWWQSNSIGWSKSDMQCKPNFVVMFVSYRETSMVHEICCSFWNSDLVEYSHLNEQYENCWEVISLVSIAICPTSRSLSSSENYLFCIPVLHNRFLGEGETAWSLLNYK